MPITLPSLVLFLHIVAAFWLAAGAFAGTVVRAQIRRSSELRDKVVALRIAARLVKIFVVPGSIVAGLLGFWLVTARGWGFRPGWVQASSALYLAMLVLGLGYLAPRLRATLRAAEASLATGAPNAELQRLTASKLPGILADVNALGIVILTLLMTLKPF